MKKSPFFLFLSISALLLIAPLSSQEGGLSTAQVQQYQQEYDDKYFEINKDFAKLRHVLLHLMMSLGKVASYCDLKEHGKEPDPSSLLNEALPDLYMRALQISNLFEVDLGSKYEERIHANIKKRASK